MSEAISLEAQVNQQVILAMKAHDAVRTTTLRLIKNALKNKFIERPQPDPGQSGQGSSGQPGRSLAPGEAH